MHHRNGVGRISGGASSASLDPTELWATGQPRMVLKVWLEASVRLSEESWDAQQEAVTRGVCRLGI